MKCVEDVEDVWNHSETESLPVKRGVGIYQCGSSAGRRGQGKDSEGTLHLDRPFAKGAAHKGGLFTRSPPKVIYTSEL